MILSLGLWNSISTPAVLTRAAVPLGLVFDFVAKWIKKWFCEIVDDPWWVLNEFWCVLVSFPLFFEAFTGFRWFPAYPADPLSQAST